MKRWRWVELNVVYAIHDRQIAEHGGLDGIRGENAVEVALSRPKNLAQYENPDIASLAASYAYSLARGHGFSDATKRAAWVVARLFLLDNRHTIEFESPEAVKLMEGVAAGTISENDLGQWFRKRLHPLRRRSQ